MLINQKGYYRGTIIDGGLGQSTNSFPQEVLMLRADSIFDPDANDYVPADPENNEITYYGVLIDGKDRITLNCKQLKKITGWDGTDFRTLVEMEITGLPIQFRVEPREYNGNTTLQVTWIDEPGAPPYRTMEKLDVSAALELTKRYTAVLSASKTPATPVSAKTTMPAKAAKTLKVAKNVKIQALSAVEAISGVPISPAAENISPIKSAPTQRTSRPALPASAIPLVQSVAIGSCSADEAWEECVQLRRNTVTDEQLVEEWRKATMEQAHDGNEDAITNEGWFLIKQAVLTKVSRV